ncbi:DNA-3-methyladenine glycosylase [Chryseobacterium cheonjiense]|uniref:Putative 3-methyladenine DNA glycosylase n=1 Tax=Chryseobacterium cheonjiense TaxID=2728845 RepID=A0A7Y0FI65_9FLAO|nr:DNA-3-methyladenine glycosylase [Chryseobacterium cheonjiense]NML57026.1 DNA-3-methyladenine glycosylase [Chryseobacterium cheonjiense]
MSKLKPEYYQNTDAIFLAQDLLGKILFTRKNGEVTAGIITETEAYFGTEDKASHAYGGRRSSRTEAMYQPGGFSYVYLCYGIHHLFNIVVSKEDDPKSVLVRSVEPYKGLEIIRKRRNMAVTDKAVSSGPGSASKALGIDMSFNKKSLTGDEIWIEDSGLLYGSEDITSTPRVGVAYAQEHALLPLRFYLKNNRYISKNK